MITQRCPAQWQGNEGVNKSQNQYAPISPDTQARAMAYDFANHKTILLNTDPKSKLLAMMQAMPQPSLEQVQSDTKAAAEGSYLRAPATAQEDDGPYATAITCGEFLQMSFPPKENLLGPILKERDLALLFAMRGTGKTLFTMQMAVALAGGGTFLKWQAPTSKKVLYIDGEMPGALMQQRVRNAREWAIGAEMNTVDKQLIIITPDTQPEAMRNLSFKEGQKWLKPWLAWADVVIMDSLLTLAPYGRSNEAESFLPMQDLLLRLRQMGKSVLLIHHAAKSGEQLGTISKETILDTVFKLSPIDEERKTAETQFALSFTKSRNFWGNDASSLIVSLQNGVWNYEDASLVMVDAVRERVEELGLTQMEIAKELGVNQSTVCRIIKAHGIKKPVQHQVRIRG